MIDIKFLSKYKDNVKNKQTSKIITVAELSILNTYNIFNETYFVQKTTYQKKNYLLKSNTTSLKSLRWATINNNNITHLEKKIIEENVRERENNKTAEKFISTSSLLFIP